jgi:hypothetical protein
MGLKPIVPGNTLNNDHGTANLLLFLTLAEQRILTGKRAVSHSTPNSSRLQSLSLLQAKKKKWKISWQAAYPQESQIKIQP